MTSQDKWEIDPQAVKDVLTATEEAGNNLAGAMGRQKLDEPIADAVAGAAGSTVVAGALAAFVENRQRTVIDVVDRVTGGITGAATATGWYVQGDEEMAATQQANLSKAVTSGDLSGFTIPE